ncbi:hypothetical protein HJC23_003784 [Cyclotella cryptica]|uniref:Nickel/cobalt efflux system n=1 Tax=Cyclotella cryptica TaxID=29204 RepID=A0ABD3QZV7_9STRA|eukprot:CCRYP_002206-RA/>CCRYP_002206-RA protein AED:0.32 eAED:0.32 QI:0/-1/0/1/-1/1/1/0/427
MSPEELVGTGIIMGIIHVLTGPDHLSALATLSATDLGSPSNPCRNNDEEGSKDWKYSKFLFGVRWGVGHSFGLLVVGGILICIQEGTTSGEWIGLNNWVTTMSETFVGVFMLALGCYGVVKALRNRRYLTVPVPTTETDMRVGRRGTLKADGSGPVQKRATSKNRLVLTGGDSHVKENRRDSIEDQMSSALDTQNIRIEALWDDGSDDRSLSDAERRLWNAARSFTDNIMMYASDDELSCGKSGLDESVVTIPMSAMIADLHLFDDLDDPDGFTITKQSTSPVSSSVANTHSIEISNMVSVQRTRIMGKGFFCRPSTLALLTGVIHGVAGTGGVLGVMPAVEMQDPDSAIIYLGTFCVTSTLVMGGFASFYGTMCKWLAGRGIGDDNRDAILNRVFLVEFGSACLSFFVGIVWLTLLAVGELNEVFP